jgi:hypothetical protein
MEELMEMYVDEGIEEAIEEEMMDYLVLSELTEDAPSKGCLIYPIVTFLLWSLHESSRANQTIT